MSVTNRIGTRILLPRSGPDAFWDALDDEFQTRNDRHWRYLAMLALRENCGWPVERIGRAFGHNKGHITRCLERIKQEIRDRFNIEDLWTDPRDRSDALDHTDPVDRTAAPNDFDPPAPRHAP